MGQAARTLRNAPLASEADQRDVMTGTKAMRAAPLLRRFPSWNEDTVLGQIFLHRALNRFERLRKSSQVELINSRCIRLH